MKTDTSLGNKNDIDTCTVTAITVREKNKTNPVTTIAWKQRKKRH